MEDQDILNFTLGAFLEESLTEQDSWLKRRHLDKAIVKKRNDHYFAIIGKKTNEKGNLCRVEIKFTPRDRQVYQILLRNKSAAIKTIKSTIGKKGKKTLAETISDEDLNRIKEILQQSNITEEKCEQFANFAISKETVTKFNL